jgi:hypothetical protein
VALGELPRWAVATAVSSKPAEFTFQLGTPLLLAADEAVADHASLGSMGDHKLLGLDDVIAELTSDRDDESVVDSHDDYFASLG